VIYLVVMLTLALLAVIVSNRSLVRDNLMHRERATEAWAKYEEAHQDAEVWQATVARLGCELHDARKGPVMY
jgi:Na+-transporting methylmalonyl-CoA/oxaloacetate decarboxylase gamma subunit